MQRKTKESMKYTVKNFKVFDEEGATFDLRPITILTGANNSGKSSVVKSMALLDRLIRNWQDEYSSLKTIYLENKKLDFSQSSQLALGDFETVLHRGADNKSFTLEYELHPNVQRRVPFFVDKDGISSEFDELISFYHGNVRLSLDFTGIDNDFQKRAHLNKFSVFTSENELIFSSSEKERFLNYNLLKKPFFQFLSQISIIYKRAELYNRKSIIEAMKKKLETRSIVPRVLTLPPSSRMPLQLDDPLAIYRSLLKENEKLIESISTDLVREKENYIHSYETGINFINIIEKSLNIFELGYSRGIFIHNDLKINDSIIQLAQELDSIFVFPLLKKIWNYTRENFYSNLIELCSTKEISDEIQIGIDDIADDFESSSFNTFGEYFKKMESEFLDQTETHNWGLNLALPSSMTYPVFGLGSNWGDSYLQFAARINGPKFDVMPDGTATPAYTKEDIERWKNRTVDFSIIYQVLTYLNVSLGYDLEWTNGDPDDIISTNAEFPHRLYEIFQKYVNTFLKAAIIPEIANIDYWSSNDLNISRIYPLEDTKGIAPLLKEFVDAKFEIEQQENKERERHQDYGVDYDDVFYRPYTFINKWLREFGVAECISIDRLEDGNAVIIKIFKKDDVTPYVLADLGSGVTQLVSTLIRIETEIIKRERKSYIKPSIIVLEEPEAHLHPNYQSKLADMLLDATENYNVHFIVETHSEYLIRKTQILVARNKYENEEDMNENNPFKIYYVPNDEKPYEMKFKTTGHFENSFGEGFFDEAGKQAIKLSNEEKTDEHIGIDWSLL